MKTPSGNYQKALLVMLHAAVVALVVWFLTKSGDSNVGLWPGAIVATASRRALLCGAALIYLLRTTAMLLVFLTRRMSWGEAITVGVLIATVQLYFAMIGGHQSAPLGVLEGAGAALYLTGSYINSVSEWQRYRWRRDPRNSGRLYTGGLFRRAVHINYFGDIVLFTGWALLTEALPLLVVPLLMAGGFVFFHIPTLDRRLSDHYGDEFRSFQQRTRKLVPFLY